MHVAVAAWLVVTLLLVLLWQPATQCIGVGAGGARGARVSFSPPPTFWPDKNVLCLSDALIWLLEKPKVKKFLTPPAWIQSQSYRFRVGARRASNVLVSVQVGNKNTDIFMQNMSSTSARAFNIDKKTLKTVFTAWFWAIFVQFCERLLGSSSVNRTGEE